MPKLKSLDTDRVDGVEDPATGMKFLIAKSVSDLDAFATDDPDELRANVEKIAGRMQQTLMALAESGLTVRTEKAAKYLNRMADALGLEGVEFEVRKATKRDQDEDEEGEEESRTDRKKSGDPIVDAIERLGTKLDKLPGATAKAVTKSIDASFQDDDDDEEPRRVRKSRDDWGDDDDREDDARFGRAMRRTQKSRQRDRSPSRKMGEGMFSNLFG